jgi:hypothetical protein
MIKRLNEQFAQTFAGDGFNSSNGVFKVKYKSFDDLSQARGREDHPYDYVKGSEFQAGDVVMAKIKNLGNKIKAEIISSARTSDGKRTVFKIKSLADNKIYTVPVYALELSNDQGNIAKKNMGASTISNRQKFLTGLKYNNGNFIWGSLESKLNSKTDILLQEGTSKMERPGIIDPSMKIVLIDTNIPDYEQHIENFKKLGIVYLVPENKTLFIHKSDPNFLKLTDNHLIVIEAVEVAKNLSKNHRDGRVQDILAAQILRNKGLKEAYKIIASNFEKKHGVSYGESLDELFSEIEGYLL